MLQACMLIVYGRCKFQYFGSFMGINYLLTSIIRQRLSLTWLLLSNQSHCPGKAICSAMENHFCGTYSLNWRAFGLHFLLGIAALAATLEHLLVCFPFILFTVKHMKLQLSISLDKDGGLDTVMGCNLSSIISKSSHISHFQSDTIARSYIITNLEFVSWSWNRHVSAVSGKLRYVDAMRLFFIFTSIERLDTVMGCNPSSIISKSSHISHFQSDTIARSYIITNLEFVSWSWNRHVSAVSGKLRYVDAMRLLIGDKGLNIMWKK
ncbi:hypothetical protein RJ641_021922 [Dillenia turbinata]|uniref:Uncharacterized protein n=1 Tax=Dillenia turbinata TaxID=194707 RepID=A0AAN8UMN8_9MAGN